MKKSKDRRVKITDEQKQEIYDLYNEGEGGISQVKLAERFGVSRRTVQFILNPESLDRNRKIARERGGWKLYYDTNRRREQNKILKEARSNEESI